MVKSKLISLLKTFTKEELKNFGDFLVSPFFNNEKILTGLFKILKKYHPEYSAKRFTKEIIYDSLFPGKKFNDAILRNTFSKMLRLCEQFLSVHQFSRDKFYTHYFLLEELKTRNQKGLYEKNKVRALSILDEDPYRNEDYFLRKYLLENLNEEFRRITGNYMVFTSKESVNLYENLSISFITNLLKVNTSIINSNKNMFGEDQNLIMFEETENYLIKNPQKLSANIYIRYYYNCIKLLLTNEDKYYFELTNLIHKEMDQLRMLDRKNIFTILANNCYYRINNGELKFIGEQFRLYKLNIEKGIYKGDRSFLSHILFMNVVTCGLEAGEFKWVEDFIIKYIDELKEEHKENMRCFSYALLNFKLKNYNKAIEFASEIINDDLSYKHQLKSLYLKIYFELNEEQPFYSHIDSYRHFVHNDRQLTEDNKNYLLNYVLFSKKLFDMRNSPDRNEYDVNIIKKEIQQNKSLINKVWLLERIKEIEKMKN